MMSSTQTRRSSASAAKRAAAASENPGKMAVPTIQPPHQAKKRVALTNLTNNAAPRHTAPTPLGNLAPAKSVKVMVPAAATATARFMAPTASTAATTAKVKRVSSSYTRSTGLRGNSVASSAVPSTSSNMASSKPILGCDRATSSLESVVAPCSMDISPSPSDAGSISLDETMSTCDSLKSSDIEYLDNADESAVASIERKTNSNLHISETTEESLEKITSASVLSSGIICKRDLLVDMETNNSILDIDNDHKDPQLCATIACDIYKHLRASENKKRPSTDFMEGVQKDINSSMRAILIDWLVEVAEEYRLVPDTLYLTVNYIDRYLSGNAMNRQHLQLLGVACMMIASKYEEICAPQVEEFCYITDNTYFKEEVLQMESAILNFLKFEMTAPTVKSFLRRFINAAHRSNEASRKSNEVPLLQLECLANYVAELSLPEYNMLSHLPSLIAASAVFLANFILQPGKRPWNATLSHYTLYKPSQLCECVKALHRLFCNSYSTSLPAIREKYSQHKYKFVAKKYCPSKIPPEYFQHPSS